MFPLQAGRLPSSSVQNIVFIVRPKLALMDLVAQNVLKYVLLNPGTYLGTEVGSAEGRAAQSSSGWGRLKDVLLSPVRGGVD